MSHGSFSDSRDDSEFALSLSSCALIGPSPCATHRSQNPLYFSHSDSSLTAGGSGNAPFEITSICAGLLGRFERQ